MFYNCVNARELYFEEMCNIAKEENRPGDVEFWSKKLKDVFDLRWVISEAIIKDIFGNVS